MTDRARNEPRDLYDVWYLTENRKINLSLLTQEITSKLEFRNRVLDNAGDEFLRKKTILKKLWHTRLANQMVELPYFDEVFRAVKRYFRNAGLIRA